MGLGTNGVVIRLLIIETSESRTFKEKGVDLFEKYGKI